MKPTPDAVAAAMTAKRYTPSTNYCMTDETGRRARPLTGTEFILATDHATLQATVREVKMALLEARNSHYDICECFACKTIDAALALLAGVPK